MNTKNAILLMGLFALFQLSCSKDFLEEKPNTNIVVPNTLKDYQQLLDNTINRTSSLPLLSCDDYYLYSDEDYQSSTSTERGSYIWAENPYGEELVRPDWNQPYQSVFYANSVIAGLKALSTADTPTRNYILGQAHFVRAFAFFDLLKTFAPAYDHASADSDAGIPLRLSPNVDEVLPRASLRNSYAQVIRDLELSIPLLPASLSPARNRASRPAAYALMSRLYLSMREYPKAELYADSTLALQSQLIDYNTLDPAIDIPFANNNPENLFWAIQTAGLSNIAVYNIYSNAGIVPELLSSYESNDLRRSLYFHPADDLGLVKPKRNYAGATDAPFSGLAVDEIYLIKAECAARRNDLSNAMLWLNRLLILRYATGTFQNKQANTSTEAIGLILMERRKSLVWRAGLRWDDLRRLNKGGANINLSRSILGQSYNLPANSPRYVFPIPEEEIRLSGISQNQR